MVFRLMAFRDDSQMSPARVRSPGRMSQISPGRAPVNLCSCTMSATTIGRCSSVAMTSASGTGFTFRPSLASVRPRSETGHTAECLVDRTGEHLVFGGPLEHPVYLIHLFVNVAAAPSFSYYLRSARLECQRSEFDGWSALIIIWWRRTSCTIAICMDGGSLWFRGSVPSVSW